MVAADLDCSGTATMLLTYGLTHVPLNVPAKLDKAGFISIFQNILLKKIQSKCNYMYGFGPTFGKSRLKL
jgi:hypothetical protein